MPVSYTLGLKNLMPALIKKAGGDRQRLVKGLQLAAQTWVPRVYQEAIATTPVQNYPTGGQLGKPVDTGAYKMSLGIGPIPNGVILMNLSPGSSHSG